MDHGSIDNLTIYTDGGCYNNGDRKGDGAYAFLIKTDNTEYVDVVCEYVENTTNNRMEMVAVIEAIKHIMEDANLDGRKYPKITLVSDSGYLVKGFTDPAYLERWISNGWKTSTNKQVQNIDLWQELNKLSWHVGFKFIHIRGHNKDSNREHAFWNDICDRACTYAINEIKRPGFIVELRYYFKTKKFEIYTIKVVERSKDK